MSSSQSEAWPSLPLEEWLDTYRTLHMWAQIIGKVRLNSTVLLNHWWNITLYVTARGLTTSPIPYGRRIFQIDFDFIDHKLIIETSEGARRSIDLAPMSVADFYQASMATLRSLDIEVAIWTTPVEVDERIPFEQDYKHASYDPESAQRFWKILVQADRVFKIFRARYIGKASPVHLFWGSMDLAVTRFSGRTAPKHPGAPNVARSVMIEAYSHEVSSCGFWPGGDPAPYPLFYSYAYPEPQGMRDWPLQPQEARYDDGAGEFVLPYEAVRTSQAPDEMLLTFLQSSYVAAATLGKWDRATLERAGFQHAIRAG